MIRVHDVLLNPDEPPENAVFHAAKVLNVRMENIDLWRLHRRSLDARKKPKIVYNCTVDIRLKNDEHLALRHAGRQAELVLETPYTIPAVTHPISLRPVVCGFGPAGMFAALLLAESGVKPLVLERGPAVEERTRAVNAFWKGGFLNPNANVQFGEGGAGTFSDGKLNTGIKDVRIRYVFKRLHRFGAPASILYDAKPHIGTDLLRDVVRRLRERILELGGEVRFNTQLTDLRTEADRLVAIQVNGEAWLPCTRLILAPGHSARDTFAMLQERGLPLAQKPFSMGVRIEHRQSAINLAQYGEAAYRGDLPPADYKLNCKFPEGDSAYTFCMCPGGAVVAAASEPGGVCTNGMSASRRDGENANAALLVTLDPSVFPGEDPLAGVRWQRELEQAAYRLGGSKYFAPAQRVEDFLAHRPSAGPGAVHPTYRPGVTWCDLHDCLPPVLTDTLEKAIPALGRKLKGFDDPDAVLTAVEARSSSPVRILRVGGQSASVLGLYPAGEGAGYAGGITSAAVDGLKAAELVLASLEVER